MGEALPDWVPGEFSGEVAFATDYAFRGISRSAEAPVIQGALGWAHSSGVHLGSFASLVDYEERTRNDASMQLDLFLGYRARIEFFEYDFRGTFRLHPNARGGLNYDYWEWGPRLGYHHAWASVFLHYQWSQDFFRGSGDGHYLALETAIPLPGPIPLPFEWPGDVGLALDLGVGRQWTEAEAVRGVADHFEWRVGLQADVLGFSLGLHYVDTDLSDGRCRAGRDVCDARVVFRLARGFVASRALP